LKLYKLTDEYGYTREDKTTWSEGYTLCLPPHINNPQLCNVIHAYKNLNLTLLLNPLYARMDFDNSYSKPVVWEAKGKIVVEDWAKIGCFKLTTIKKIPLPEWYQDRKERKRVQIRFAILCAKATRGNGKGGTKWAIATQEEAAWVEKSRASWIARTVARTAAYAHAADSKLDFCRLADRAVKEVERMTDDRICTDYNKVKCNKYCTHRIPHKNDFYHKYCNDVCEHNEESESCKYLNKKGKVLPPL